MIHTALQQLIVERIGDKGPITFAEYMHMALYEPGYGYYVSGPARVGWEGDFYTSTDVGSFFANCMGRQLQQMWEQLGKPVPFTVLEQGAGRRQLAQGIQAWVQQEAPALASALDYHTSDIQSGQDALAMTRNDIVPRVILSNELVDAFPVHIVEIRSSKLYEVYVDIRDGRLGESLGEPSSESVARYLDDYHVPWRTYGDGWRAEINLAARSWMCSTASMLLGSNSKRKRRGFLLAIDYGDKARSLYTPYRRRGTLATYFRHQMTDQPLARPGEQDITAHVNFSALIDEGRRQGLRLHTFTTQREWLTSMGLFEELERIRERDFAIIDRNRTSDQGQVALLQWYNLRQRAMVLTDPAGMGNFKVLIMKR
jgi:SAM-dependent MidA family methyltransferase